MNLNMRKIGMPDSQAFWGCSMLCLVEEGIDCILYRYMFSAYINIYTNIWGKVYYFIFVWGKEYYLPSAHDRVLFTTNFLRSINHVGKFKERDHHPTPPPPNFLRSINHVGKFKERDHHPTPPHPQPLYYTLPGAGGIPQTHR